MTTDLETQLRGLGRHWRDQLPHVDPDEILERAAARVDDGDDSSGRVVRSSQSVSPHRRGRWPIAIAAALVLLLVGALLVAVPRSGDTERADDTTPLVLRDRVEQRWSAEVAGTGDELVPLGPVALGDDVVVIAVQNLVTALDLVDGRVRWQREYDDPGPLGAIVDLTSFGETVVFSLGPRTDDDESDPAVVGLSMADGTERWRVSGGQAYGVIDGNVLEFDGLGGDEMSFRLIDPTDGSYLTEALVVDGRDGVETVGSLTVVEGADGEPTLYDTDRRVPIPFPSAVGQGATTFALAGDLVAVRADEAVLHDDEGNEIDRLRLPEVARDAPWVTAFAHRELVIVSTGDGSVGIGAESGRLAVRWESDAAVNSSAFDPMIAIDASSPLAITAGEGFTKPGGVIDLDSGEVLPIESDVRWALVARDGSAVLTAGSDDTDTLRAYARDGEPTWTLDVPAGTQGLEQWALGDDVFVLVSVTRSEAGTSLQVATYG